jgi:hypothetical protein
MNAHNAHQHSPCANYQDCANYVLGDTRDDSFHLLKFAESKRKENLICDPNHLRCRENEKNQCVLLKNLRVILEEANMKLPGITYAKPNCSSTPCVPENMMCRSSRSLVLDLQIMKVNTLTHSSALCFCRTMLTLCL